jgi:hypothetical protein
MLVSLMSILGKTVGRRLCMKIAKDVFLQPLELSDALCLVGD